MAVHREFEAGPAGGQGPKSHVFRGQGGPPRRVLALALVPAVVSVLQLGDVVGGIGHRVPPGDECGRSILLRVTALLRTNYRYCPGLRGSSPGPSGAPGGRPRRGISSRPARACACCAHSAALMPGNNPSSQPTSWACARRISESLEVASSGKVSGSGSFCTSADKPS